MTLDLPWKFFSQFLKSGADRFERLSSIVEACSLAQNDGSHIVKFGGVRHFLLSAEKQNLGKRPPVVLAAHYDAVPGSPGANDNGAAVFMLLETAMILRERKAADWLVILTGKEELAAGEGLEKQGSFTLALALSKTVLKACPFYIFDCCGRGDTIVLSTTAAGFFSREKTKAAQKSLEKISMLRDTALKASARCGLSNVRLLPTPFSDDAGFLLAGRPAQTITVLPCGEASAFVSLSRNRSFSSDGLVNKNAPPLSGEKQFPKTWHLINSSDDTLSTLTLNHKNNIVKLALELCDGK
jgi:hypothetical protein